MSQGSCNATRIRAKTSPLWAQQDMPKVVNEVERLQAIVDLLPQRGSKPVVPSVDPEDGTAERLGIVFRYSKEAAEAAGDPKIVSVATSQSLIQAGERAMLRIKKPSRLGPGDRARGE